MTTPQGYCTKSGNTFVPTALARGPWGQTIVGHVVGGLLARAVEHVGEDSNFQPARITVDMVRPAMLEPVEATAELQHTGRRVRIVEAALRQGGAVVAKATALLLKRSEHPSEPVWSMPMTMPPVPAEPVPLPAPIFVHSYGWSAEGAGTVLPTEWPGAAPEGKFAWVRNVTPLLDNESDSAFVRAAMAADLTSAVAHWGEKHMNFINVDYSLALSRLPSGPYIGLAALTHAGFDGVASGSVAIFDSDGQIGTGVANALSNPGFTAPY